MILVLLMKLSEANTPSSTVPFSTSPTCGAICETCHAPRAVDISELGSRFVFRRLHMARRVGPESLRYEMANGENDLRLENPALESPLADLSYHCWISRFMSKVAWNPLRRNRYRRKLNMCQISKRETGGKKALGYLLILSMWLSGSLWSTSYPLIA